ncbi:hypothetical protein Aduo_013847 [Ancylostoma duodenale]
MAKLYFIALVIVSRALVRSIYDDTQTDTAEQIMTNAINSNILQQITIYPLSIATRGTVISNATYNGPEELQTYANAIRPSDTEIGCALNRCTSDKRDSLYCVFNSPCVFFKINR